MLYTIPFIGATALLSGLVSALPRPADSAVGEEVAVSAPNGVIMSDTAALAAQTASAASSGSSMMGSDSKMGSDSMKMGSDSKKMGSDSMMGHSSMMSQSTMMSSMTTSAASSSPTYGSGKSNWGGSGYNDCVQQCIASHGAPAASYMPTATSGSSGSSGSGATHTVIVAPTQGVLRYVPFAINASVGDTVKFMWGANNHTVTKSSQLNPCNKTQDAPFISGTQNKDFVFTQVVNDTSPTFFYCGTPGHCPKGMFGIINPPNALGSPSSVSGMMQSLTSNSSDMAAMASYSNQMSGSSKASSWGGSIDMKAMPSWSHQYIAQNVMYTRNFLAANSEVIKDDGSIDLGAAGSTPMMIPQDITSALSNSGASSSSYASATSDASSSAASSAASSSPSAVGAKSNGASSLTSPRILVGIMTVVATLFVL